MGVIRTYLDAGVLIVAARGASGISERALAILDDSTRVFVASRYLQFEVFPKPRFHDVVAELELYEEFFASAAEVAPFDMDDLDAGFQAACEYGLGAFDAIHLTVAKKLDCAEFITTERATSPIFRFPGIRIVTII